MGVSTSFEFGHPDSEINVTRLKMPRSAAGLSQIVALSCSKDDSVEVI